MDPKSNQKRIDMAQLSPCVSRQSPLYRERGDTVLYDPHEDLIEAGCYTWAQRYDNWSGGWLSGMLDLGQVPAVCMALVVSFLSVPVAWCLWPILKPFARTVDRFSAFVFRGTPSWDAPGPNWTFELGLWSK